MKSSLGHLLIIYLQASYDLRNMYMYSYLSYVATIHIYTGIVHYKMLSIAKLQNNVVYI